MDRAQRTQIKVWMAGSPETNVKELKWQLMGLGNYVNETDIKDIQLELLREKCRCHDDSGSCDACLIFYNGGFE